MHEIDDAPERAAALFERMAPGLPPPTAVRREPLTLAGVSTWGVRAQGGLSYRLKVAIDTGGAALVRRGVLSPPGIAPGIQLYTVRSLMAKDVAGTLDALARIGYREVEFAGLHGTSASAVRAMLDHLGLSAPASHVGLNELRKDAAAVFAQSRALGNRYVVVPWIDAAERRTIAGYEAVADALNRFGTAAESQRMNVSLSPPAAHTTTGPTGTYAAPARV